MNSYDVGQRVRITATFRDAADVLTNTTATIKVRDPAGVVETYTGGELTSTSTGAYYVDVTATTDGVWRYRAESTGAVIAAEEHAFAVTDSQFD